MADVKTSLYEATISRNGIAYIMAKIDSGPSFDGYTGQAQIAFYDGTFALKTWTGLVWGSYFGFDNVDVSEKFEENTSHHYSLYVEYNGEPVWSSLISGDITRPSRVYSIDVPSALTLTTNQSTKWINAKAYGKNGGDCEITTFNYVSSDTSIATVDSGGNVTKVANGICTITVTSTDEYAQCGSVEILIHCIDSADYPEDMPTGDVDYLTADLMQDVIDAIASIAEAKSIAITGDTRAFNSYLTPIQDVYSVVNGANTSIKELCTGTSTETTLPDTIPYLNTDSQWYTIINEWLRVLNLMHNS